MRFAIIFVAVCCLYLVQAEEEDLCYDSNATWRACRNTCQPTCENPESTEVCTEVCEPGCDCNEGYVYFEYTCIPKSECKSCADPNAFYTSCGTACPLTCENPIEGICVGMCVEGCTCRPGFFLNDDGDCVLLEDC